MEDYNLLKGVRVVELTNYIAGPTAGRCLADWGAEVIKIEPPGGDLVRYHVVLPGMVSKPEMTVGFELVNANKKSVVANMKTPEGKEIMDKLLQSADVFLTNNRTDALVKMGLDYETLSAKYPRLVWAQLGGYGEKGPLAKAPGFDTIAYWSISGAMNDFVERDTSPLIVPIGFGDLGVGCTLAGAICAALYRQKQTGEGRKVVVSLFAQAVWQMGVILTTQPFGQDKYPKSRLETTPLANTYRCSDGKWILISCLEYERFYPQLMKFIGREDLINDERFNTWAAGRANCGELIHILSNAFEKYTQAELHEYFLKMDIPHSMLQSISGFLGPEQENHQQAVANEFLHKITHRNGVSLYEAATPAQFGGAQAAPRVNAPLLGEQTSIYLKEIGYSDEQIKKLLARGIVEEHHDTNY
ncbi:Cinnamoyl-CoA:phenyllactate CoA-transferase [bioreactor metagenome]|uniref:Cinnamoyl-CoA:phenyllactate CoA-transferase n=1 Tax=bioreactor metagenome TaxID=1076179 RepID=A0A644X8R3_9ZZZZ